jgi:hypothetical protein
VDLALVEAEILGFRLLSFLLIIEPLLEALLDEFAEGR